METEEKIVKIIDKTITSSQLSVTQRGAKGAAAVEVVDTNGDPITDINDIALKRVVQALQSLTIVDLNGRLKVTIDAGILPVVTTVSTVTTVGNATALGGVDARYLITDTARNAYANGVRQNLSFS